MSHVVNIEAEVTDLEALKDACKEMGLTFIENSKTYQWWGQYEGDSPLPTGFKEKDLGKCEHEIKVPGTSWSVGVVKSRVPGRKGYTFMFDYYGTKGRPILKALGGEKAEKLIQMYSVHKTERALKSKGYKYTRTKQKNGDVLINAVVG